MPNWYDQNLKKHWKDYPKGPKDLNRSQIVDLWHISPEKIVVPSALSTFRGVNGIYFSPSYKSAIKDWSTWVANKKYRTNSLSVQKEKLWDELMKMEEEMEKDWVAKNPNNRVGPNFEDNPKYKKLSDKYKEFSDRKQDIGSTWYKSIYINHFVLPTWAYKEASDWFFGFMPKGDSPDALNEVMFWGWGDQIFLPQKYFKYLKFVSAKKLDRNQLLQHYNEM
jgi:hypothetical protein